MRTGNRGPLPLVLLLVAGLGFGIERLVVTDTEAIEAQLERARRLVAERDFVGLRPLLSDAFTWGRHGPDEAVARLTTLYESTRPPRIEVDWGPVTPLRDHADVVVRVRASLLGRGYEGEALVVFAREADGWRVLRLEADGG